MRKLSVLLLALLIPLLAACGAEAEPQSVPPVYTDWSKLTPYEPVKQVFSYHPGYSADGAFVPRDDYGTLLPYIGRYSAMEHYVIDTLPFYGLVTDKGELVSAPVYAKAAFNGAFLLLSRSDDASSGGFSLTLAAADGRWAHELPGSYCVGGGCGLLMTCSEDGSLVLWNEAGDEVMRFDGELFAPLSGDKLNWGGEGGPYVNWTDTRLGYVVTYRAEGGELDSPLCLYLDFETGAVSDTPPEGYPPQIDYSLLSAESPEPPEVGDAGYLQPLTDAVTGETYFYGYVRQAEGDGSVCTLFDGDGNALLGGIDLSRFEMGPMLRAGLCAVIEDGCFCYRSVPDGALVFRCTMRTNSD